MIKIDGIIREKELSEKIIIDENDRSKKGEMKIVKVGQEYDYKYEI